MKVFLIGTAVVCLSLSMVHSSSGQDIDPQCNDKYDKIACTCAVRNGGRIIPPPVGVKREGMTLRPREGPETMRTLDGGQVAFRHYFKREGLKVRRSPAVEGYLTCMHRFGRK